MTDTEADSWGLPAPAHVEACIEYWRALDLRSARDDEIEDSLLQLRNSIGRWLVQRKTTRFPSLWRVRKKGDRFGRVSDFWYPAAEHVERPGRCNKPRQSVLYAAPEAITALDEMNVVIGDMLVLIQYRGLRRMGVDRIVGFADPNPQRGERIIEGNNLASYQLLRGFLQEEFTRPVGEGETHLYRISAAICRTWTDGADNDGWIYPSVKSMDRENVALLPESAQAGLEVKAAYLVEVADDRIATTRLGRSRGMTLRGIDTAAVAHDSVIWTGQRVSLKFYR